MENKLFDVDYNKKNYKITIEVCENGNIFGVEKINQDYNVSYDSVIGTLEIVKSNLINEQTKKNKKKNVKKQKK
jgi:hypothetical protein